MPMHGGSSERWGGLVPAGGGASIRALAPASRLLWAALIWLLGLTSILTGYFSSQFFHASYSDLLAASSGNPGRAEQVTRLATLCMLGLAVAALMISLHLPLIRRGFWVWAGTMALSIGTLLSSVLGLVPSLQPGLLRLPIVVTIAYLLPAVELGWFATQVRRVIAVYVWVTLVAAFVMPERVLERGYAVGVLPGIDFRLHGIGGHANNFAALLLTWIMLGWVTKSSGWLWRVNEVAVFACLILAQSKTVWIAAAAAYVIRFAFLRGTQRYVALTALAGGLAAAALAISLLFPTALDDAASTVRGPSGESAFSGRQGVWDYTMGLWRQNPLFGYGPNLWDARMGLHYAALRGWTPPHAHSQFYQTLGESGLVGLAGLAVFAVGVSVAAVRHAGVSRGVTLALAVALVIRSFSEPPLRAAVGENLFVLFVTVAVMILAARSHGPPELPAGKRGVEALVDG
jgi:hypothetical protein